MWSFLSNSYTFVPQTTAPSIDGGANDSVKIEGLFLCFEWERKRCES